MTSDRRFARRLHACLDQILTSAGQRLDADQLARRPWRQRALDRVAFGIMRAVLFLTGHRY